MPDTANADPPHLFPRRPGGGLERQGRHARQVRAPRHRTLIRVHRHERLAVVDGDALGHDGLAVDQRHFERHRALHGRHPEHGRRYRPVKVKVDCALHASEGRKAAALPTQRRVAGIPGLQARQLQGAGQQPAILDAGDEPAVAIDLDGPGRRRKRDLQAVDDRYGAAQCNRVLAGTEPQPQCAVAIAHDL